MKMHISYIISQSKLGYFLVAMTHKGICALKLGDDRGELEKLLYAQFNQAKIEPNQFTHPEWIEEITNYTAGKSTSLNLPLDIQGSTFQMQVWQALQKIPPGETRTYTDIAKVIGKPNAVRAVGSACGANPVALVIPCHRIVRSDGGLGGYEWGLERKKKLLAQERLLF